MSLTLNAFLSAYIPNNTLSQPSKTSSAAINVEPSEQTAAVTSGNTLEELIAQAEAIDNMANEQFADFLNPSSIQAPFLGEPVQVSQDSKLSEELQNLIRDFFNKTDEAGLAAFEKGGNNLSDLIDTAHNIDLLLSHSPSCFSTSRKRTEFELNAKLTLKNRVQLATDAKKRYYHTKIRGLFIYIIFSVLLKIVRPKTEFGNMPCLQKARDFINKPLTANYLF